MTAKETAKKIRALKRGEHKEDLEQIARLVERYDWKAAWKKLRHLDTFMRELFPDDVYTFLESKNAGKMRVIKATVLAKGSKKVFNEELGPGVLAVVTMQVPEGRTDTQMAMMVMHQEEAILKDLFEVKWSDEGTVKA